jgi:hypothetical protein
MPAFGKEIHRLTHWYEYKKSKIGKNSPFVNSQLAKVLYLRQNNLCEFYLWKDSLLLEDLSDVQPVVHYRHVLSYRLCYLARTST